MTMPVHSRAYYSVWAWVRIYTFATTTFYSVFLQQSSNVIYNVNIHLAVISSGLIAPSRNMLFRKL